MFFTARTMSSPIVARASRVVQAVLAIVFVVLSLSEIGLAMNGIFLGSVLALGAVGITLVFGVMRFANIAHGDMMTMGAYVAFFLLVSVLPEHTGLGPFTFGFPLLIAIPVSMAAVAALAVGLDVLVFRRLRLRRANIVTVEIASLGLAIAIRGFIQMIWDTPVRYLPNEGRQHFSLPADISIAPNHLFVSGAALVLAIVLHLLLTRTKQGKAMRATSDNPDLARASGINTDRVLLWTWGIAGALAGAAGVLLVVFNATSQLKPTIGFQLPRAALRGGGRRRHRQSIRGVPGRDAYRHLDGGLHGVGAANLQARDSVHRHGGRAAVQAARAPGEQGLMLEFLTAFAILVGIYSVFALGLNVHWGYTGLFNIGVAGFFALGAYAASLLTIRPPLSDQGEDYLYAGDLANRLDALPVIGALDLWFVAALVAASLVAAVVCARGRNDHHPAAG